MSSTSAGTPPRRDALCSRAPQARCPRLTNAATCLVLVIRTFGLPHTVAITNIRITPYHRHHQYSDHPIPSPSPIFGSPHTIAITHTRITPHHRHHPHPHHPTSKPRPYGVNRTCVFMTARGFPDVRFTRTSHVAFFVGLNHGRYAREHKASLRWRDSGDAGFSGRWWLRRYGVFRTVVVTAVWSSPAFVDRI